MEVKMLIRKLTNGIKESREEENNVADTEKNRYLIEYLAMMTDVELPTDNTNEEVTDFE